jgi:GntR family transcriptional regulator
MPIWLEVNPRSGIPLYVQLVEQIRRALELGLLRPGDALPTVRQLARELTIAPNTIVKAYGELETRGLIETRAGAGTSVSMRLHDMLQQEARERLRERLHQWVQDAVALQISEREVQAWIQQDVQQVFADASAAADERDTEDIC